MYALRFSRRRRTDFHSYVLFLARMSLKKQFAANRNRDIGLRGSGGRLRIVLLETSPCQDNKLD